MARPFGPAVTMGIAGMAVPAILTKKTPGRRDWLTTVLVTVKALLEAPLGADILTMGTYRLPAGWMGIAGMAGGTVTISRLGLILVATMTDGQTGGDQILPAIEAAMQLPLFPVRGMRIGIMAVKTTHVRAPTLEVEAMARILAVDEHIATRFEV